MKRSHLLPPAKEILMRPKSYGGSYRMPDPPADLHPVEVVLAACTGLSLVSIVICVFIQVVQSGSSDPDYEYVGRVVDVLWLSVVGLLISVLLYLVWSRFVRHG
jgi:hypothetical protein